MYVPRHFAEERIEVLADVMRRRPFATLVTLGDDGLVASHLPLLWDPEPAPYGTLTGHLARANPQWRSAAPSSDALAIFTAGDAYVSPSWYASKREHGKVVPTWNYVAVHAAGPLRAVDDPEWLHALVTRLTDVHEATLPEPWKVGDAPAEYVAQLAKAIVGIEIEVHRLEGKWKLAQNRPAEDFAGTIAGLEQRGDPSSLAVAQAMRTWRDEHGES